MLDQISQVMILTTGIAAMWLVASESPRDRMWAGVMGLCSEPFWFYTTYNADQGFITILAIIYLINWSRVFWKNRKLVIRQRNNLKAG